jgi:hypothetical protein
MSLSNYLPSVTERPPATAAAHADPVSAPPLPPKLAKACCAASLCLFVGTVLLMVLLPLSFVSLEYYELGLLKSRTRGVVEASQVGW